jgi:DNA-binding transcriptional LysR family regulator
VTHRQPELRHLRYFVAVAEHQHFGRAAKALHTSQPSVSNQIRQLEADVGTPLFVRTTRRVRLTPAGEIFLEETRRLLAQLESGLRHAREAARGMRGRLRLAYISGSMHDTLPRILRDFSEAYPDVALYLASMWTDEQIDALRERRLDVGIFPNGLDVDGLERQDGWRNELVLAMPIGHKLERKPHLRYGDLEGQPLIVPRASGSHMGDSIVDVCRLHDVNTVVIYEGAEVDTIIGLVAARQGLALVPASWSCNPHFGVRFRRRRFFPAWHSIGMPKIWTRGCVRSSRRQQRRSRRRFPRRRACRWRRRQVARTVRRTVREAGATRLKGNRSAGHLDAET